MLQKVRGICLLGVGTVGSGIIQILPKFIQTDVIHIVDKVSNLKEIVDNLIEMSLPEIRRELLQVKIHTHMMELSAGTIESQLRPLFEQCGAVLDLTTVVDSEICARLADSCGCVYINACLEVFQEEEDLSEAQRHARFRRIRGEFRNTMVLETGMNPGLISLLCKRGMRDAGIKSEDVHTIHVTEYDTHVMRPEHREQDAFYNTWSPFGLYEEAVKRAEMAWPQSSQVPPGWQSEGHLICHEQKSGAEVALKSVTPVWIGGHSDQQSWEWRPYWGFVVTHGEVETISTRLGKHIKCAFVFHVCPDGVDGLGRWGHNHAPRYVMMQGRHILESDHHTSADNIGALILTRDNRGWWTGSMMKSMEAQRVSGARNNGANITVSAACLATVAWCLAHPMKGCHFPDDIDDEGSEWILRACEPFLGKVMSVEVPKHLLPDLNQPFIYTKLGEFPKE